MPALGELGDSLSPRMKSETLKTNSSSKLRFSKSELFSVIVA